MPPAVGIDLGTTKSVIGVWQDGSCRIITDNIGHQSIPSLIVVTSDELILAGRQAQQHPDRYKSKNITISSVKRLMGRRGETGWGWWKAYPQEVSAFILAELKSQAENYLGEEINRAVIAIPSHFDEAQRRATKEAADIAGLEVIRLLNEATAAVLAYGFYKHSDETTLVFDFGGGTLDISVVAFGEGTYQVQSIEGDSKLGGDDFDQVFVDYVSYRIRQDYGSTIEWGPIQKAILKETAEKAKVELSGTLATKIYIPGFLRIGQSYQDLNIHLERSTFEQLSKSLVDRAIILLNKALNSAGMKASNLNSVLLLGGTSRIPFIREAVRKELGKEPITGVDIETCVAQGAVIQSATLQGSLGEVLLLDCIPSSYGIGLKDDIFSPLILKNTTIPTIGSQIFTTTTDNQSAIPIAIYQGESGKASENNFLGTIELRDILPAAAGVPQIEVTFNVDPNMIIQAKARDKGTGKEQTIQVKSPYGLNNTQIKLMHQRLKSWRSERRIMNIKRELELLISVAEEILTKNAIALGWDEVLTLRECYTSLATTKTKKCSYEELTSMLHTTRPIIEKAQKKTVEYIKAVQDINHLAAEVERLAPLMASEEAFSLLTQGIDLLKDYIQRHSSLDELQKTLPAVRNVYKETKATFIKREMDNIRTSEEMVQWAGEVEKSLSDSSLVRQELLKLKNINSVQRVVELLERENADYRASIQREVSECIRGDPYSEACLFLVISSLIDHHHVSDINKVPLDDSNSTIVAFSIFNSLDKDRPDDIRRVAAQAIANYLPDFKYIAPIVNRIYDEPDTITKKYLMDCVNRQSPGVLEKLFMNADTEIRARIAADEGLLLKLAREPNHEMRIFALQSLANSPPSDYTQVSDLFSQALLDPISKIRILAIEFIERQSEPSCFSRILDLLQSEMDEMVIERAVAALCNLRNPESVPHLLRLLVEKSSNIRTILLPVLEKERESMDSDMRSLLELTKKISSGEHTVGFRDSIFLRRLSRKHPEMKGLVKILKERQSRKQAIQNE
jgi:molecular chaperone DnaK